MRLPTVQTQLSALLLSLILFSTRISSQAAPSNSNLPNLKTITNSDSSSSKTAAASSTSQDSSSPSTTDSLPNLSTLTTQTSGTAVTGLPSLTSADYDGPTGLPKLPNTAAPSYPPPSVPPTANAPFMQKSSLPSGTVFICVGAIIGFCFFLVFAWRGFAAWSLHRSVRRDNAGIIRKHRGKGHINLFKNSGGGVYSHAHTSSLSLEPLTKGSMGASNTVTPRDSTLFFSPTAGPGLSTQHGRNNSVGYLPAGYYAAGAAAPANGSGSLHLGAGGIRQSLQNIVPQSQGYTKARDSSLPPSRGAENMPAERLTYGASSGQQGRAADGRRESGGQGRAPTAMLDDMFESYPPGN